MPPYAKVVGNDVASSGSDYPDSGSSSVEACIDRSVNCIEIEFVQDEAGNFQDRIIISLPHEVNLTINNTSPPTSPNKQKDNVGEAKDGKNAILNNNRNTDQEEKEDEYSIMEDLTNTFDSWLGCQYSPTTPALKSALRSKYDQPSIDRNVSFTKLQIREFNMTLGDHPSAVTGPPVMLDWNSKPEEREVDLDQYEEARQPRRNRRQLKLSFEDRRGILEQQRGFTVEQIKEAWREALMIRKQRQETRKRGPTLTMVDEAWESACRKYQRVLDGFIDALSLLGLNEFVAAEEPTTTTTTTTTTTKTTPTKTTCLPTTTSSTTSPEPNTPPTAVCSPVAV